MALLRRLVQAEHQDVMSSEPGDDVTLPCQSADPNITAVEWTRPDLGPEYIFLSVDGHFKPQNQHPSFQGRVQLVDGDLKDGDASLLLKNVRSSDEGTYECRVTVDDLHRRAIINEDPISKVILQVTGSGSDDGDLVDGDDTDTFIGSVTAAAAAAAVAVAAVAVFLLCLYVVKVVFTKCKRRLNNEPEAPPPPPPAAADGAEMVELCDM